MLISSLFEFESFFGFRSKVASHANHLWPVSKAPPLFIPHTWLKALRVNRHNLVLGMGPSHSLFPFFFLIPLFLFPSLPAREGPSIWTNHPRSKLVPVGPSHIWVCLKAMAQREGGVLQFKLVLVSFNMRCVLNSNHKYFRVNRY